jgi:hypothetical protein
MVSIKINSQVSKESVDIDINNSLKSRNKRSKIMDYDYEVDMSEYSVEENISDAEIEIKEIESKITNYKKFLSDYRKYLKKLKALPEDELILGGHDLEFPPNEIDYDVY